MFTGIIEEIGNIKALHGGSVSAVLSIGAKAVLEDLKIGDSVAVNGVCLTVTSLTTESFVADVMHETLRRTNLGRLHAGSPVNLERAMRASGRFDGHLVTGHVDGTGTVQSVRQDGNALWFTIRTEAKLLRYILEKGSISVDGTSLTVTAVSDTNFCVSLIPHTAAHSILAQKRCGDTVNLETDYIGKYVEKLMGCTDKRAALQWKTTF